MNNTVHVWGELVNHYPISQGWTPGVLVIVCFCFGVLGLGFLFSLPLRLTKLVCYTHVHVHVYRICNSLCMTWLLVQYYMCIAYTCTHVSNLHVCVHVHVHVHVCIHVHVHVHVCIHVHMCIGMVGPDKPAIPGQLFRTC